MPIAVNVAFTFATVNEQGVVSDAEGQSQILDDRYNKAVMFGGTIYNGRGARINIGGECKGSNITFTHPILGALKRGGELLQEGKIHFFFDEQGEGVNGMSRGVLTSIMYVKEDNASDEFLLELLEEILAHNEPYKIFR